MTQEEKELLVKDLCARLPYRVKISVDDDYDLFIPRLKFINGPVCYFYECAWGKFVDQIKPYLRPMSSMTEEEKKEDAMFFRAFSCSMYERESVERIDWLNAHHFDYRGLIEKGLALEAPEDMYK